MKFRDFFASDIEVEQDTKHSDLRVIRGVMKKVLEQGLNLVPKDCAKFAKTLMNQISGQIKSDGGDPKDGVVQRLTLTTLMEFFANGVIENEHIYRELRLGNISKVSELETIGHINVQG